MNKPVSIGQPLLDLNNTIMDKFHYDHMLQKYESKIKLCHIDKYSFAYEIETYRGIRKELETQFDSGYLKIGNKPLPIGRNKKFLGMVNDELSEKVMTDFVALRAKILTYEI